MGAVGRRLGLTGTELADLTTATRVRDIGMATVPDEIITKDGPLDDHEWAVIRMHPERSADMLDPAPAFARVREIVRASHEHLDGSGYPHGLTADRIPLGARILLAVESYLAMTGERRYGGMLSDAGQPRPHPARRRAHLRPGGRRRAGRRGRVQASAG